MLGHSFLRFADNSFCVCIFCYQEPVLPEIWYWNVPKLIFFDKAENNEVSSGALHFLQLLHLMHLKRLFYGPSCQRLDPPSSGRVG